MDWITYPVKDDSTYIKDYQLDGTAAVYKDLRYGRGSDKQSLDLYIPHAGKAPYPLIVYIHGGGFIQGDKTRHLMAMLQGLRYGYALAAVNYRLADEAVYPAMVDDVAEGIRFLKAKALQYALDPQRFLLWGETHGAFLACQIGIGGSKGRLDGTSSDHPDDTLCVAGVVDYWAPTSLEELHHLEKVVHKGETVPRSLEELQFRAKGEDLAALLKKSVHPLEHVDGTEPPIYIVHGAEDDVMPLAFSRSYQYTLKAAGNDVALEVLPGTGHGLAHIQNADQIEGTYQFIHRIFAV